MIFGDKEKLAIECIFDEKSKTDEQILFGRIAILAGGFRLGDISLTVILNIPMLFFQQSLKDCEKRRSDFFNQMNAEAVWELLYSALYDNYESDINESYELDKKYRKFCICPGFSEAFDGEIAFLIEDEQEERFIWMDAQTEQIKEVRLRPETYKNVVESLLSGIQTNYS
ncbi:Imm42 family immunity protein [Anabaena azotica]|uniref:Uncharacterized protein n=1 Tax=Anabaena azotica FACHB-119 TaxID=947527 RepID=A0ABR8D7D4_9NOST|nr:Imm42 family immunity protein [Anabaena azotica]MBD2501668.1 hypothetical protein [Anabaena azotica FACHB-119]